MRAHPSAAKLALTSKLPRLPGVYLFRDRGGRVLYVGKATNLRARVRSYFSTEDRRKVPQLLRETVSIEHRVLPRPVRGRGARASPDPAARTPLQPGVEVVAALLVPEAHGRAVSPARGHAGSRRPTVRPTSGRSVRAAPRIGRARPSKTPCRSGAAAPGSAAPRSSRADRRACRRSSASRRARAGRRSTKTSYGELADVVRRGLGEEPALLCAPLEARMHRLARRGALRGGGRNA